MVSSPGNVEDFWEEYTGLCELEKQGKTWRQWKGGRAAWAWRKFVAEEIMADIAMETAAGNDETAATKLALERMQGRLTKYKDDKMADISARVKGVRRDRASRWGRSGRRYAGVATEETEGAPLRGKVWGMYETEK